MTDPQAIADGLSEAEASALCGRWAWRSLEHAEDGEARLFELGLWSAANIRSRKKAITPLGASVRAILAKAGD